MVETDYRDRSITAQAFKSGNRKKMLIINKRDRQLASNCQEMQ